MKHKKLFRSVTALLAALVLMGGFSVTAFAGGGDVSDEPPTPVTETEPEETTGGYEPQPLTPEGNMSLVDDITGEASGDKKRPAINSLLPSLRKTETIFTSSLTEPRTEKTPSISSIKLMKKTFCSLWRTNRPKPPLVAVLKNALPEASTPIAPFAAST